MSSVSLGWLGIWTHCGDKFSDFDANLRNSDVFIITPLSVRYSQSVTDKLWPPASSGSTIWYSILMVDPDTVPRASPIMSSAVAVNVFPSPSVRNHLRLCCNVA